MSFESLRDVAFGLLERDREVLKIMLESQHEELFGPVEEYLELSLRTLDLYAELRKLAESLRNEKNTMKLSEQNAAEFRSLYARHVQMRRKLSSQKQKLDKKMRLLKGWMKVSSAILATPCVAILICAAVAALGAWSSLPVEAIGRWFESRGRGYERRVRARRDLVGEMYLATFLTLADLDTVRVLLDRLEGEMDRIVRSMEFGERHPSSVELLVEQIRRQRGEFMAEVEEFQRHVDVCSKAICRARSVVLHRIIHFPSSSSFNESR